MLDTELQNQVIQLAAKRYAGYSFALLHGSRVHGNATQESDVDLVVVFNETIKPYREFFTENNYSYDVFVYDAETLHFHVSMAKKMGRTAILTIVNSSVTLPKPTNASSYILLTSQATDRAPLELGNTQHLRLFIANLLADLKKSKDKLEMNSLAIELYKVIAECILLEKGIGGSVRKYINKALQENAFEQYFQLNDAIEQVFECGKVYSLLQLGQSALDKLGGALKGDFKMLLPEGGRLPLPTDFKLAA